MSIEHRRSCTGSAPHVAKRLYATIVLFIGIICIFGGYLLGRMARNEVKRTNDIVSINLTISADNLYKRSKRILPKAVHHNDSEKVAARILEAFNCSQSECGTMTNYNVAELVKNCITVEVSKLIRSIRNVTLYLDSLR
ncbi:unnamed protein product [Parnassius apollo]|uniref:(apollo) hypothetical protein n=1 Tax=Parnassius apollo TaxID=110799 RepID=A0A8S3X5K0_PARAO|nr:unnamed protein product [Parnassius apollo]